MRPEMYTQGASQVLVNLLLELGSGYTGLSF